VKIERFEIDSIKRKQDSSEKEKQLKIHSDKKKLGEHYLRTMERQNSDVSLHKMKSIERKRNNKNSQVFSKQDELKEAIKQRI
jgi:hypothetical protein